MKAAHRVLLATGFTIGAAVAEETVAAYVLDKAPEYSNVTDGLMIAGGAIAAFVGYITKVDGVSDALEASGIGVVSLASLRLGLAKAGIQQ